MTGHERTGPRQGQRRERPLAKVPLIVLSVRTAATSGKRYLSGWLGLSKVVGFETEPDKYGNRTFTLFLQEAPPKPGDGTNTTGGTTCDPT